jgi:peptidoglycan/xylan/chitin deacetylase (PgdA/CDA1 family)
MEHQLEHLRARRAARARALRRRRIAALALFIAAIGVVAATSIGASGRAVRPIAAVTSAPATAPLKAGVTTQLRGAVTRDSLPTTQQLRAVARLASYGLPVYCGGRSKRMVALTFDDGPGPYTTLAIKKLREHHLRATFFLVGKEIIAHPGLARLEKPVAAVGDHTMTHAFLPALSQPAMVQEIAGARTLIEHAAGQLVVLFRPPYEAHTAAIDSEVRALRMLEVLWNVDSGDSLGADYAGIERNVIAGLRPGSIILMHENHGQTIRALPAIFAALRRHHLRAVTIPELIAADLPSLAQLRRGERGCSVSLKRGSGG